MATITASYNRSNQTLKATGFDNVFGLGHTARGPAAWSKMHPAAFVIGMAGYFLILASIAVIFITQQFPWFMLAPVTILLGYAYIRHAENKRYKG